MHARTPRRTVAAGYRRGLVEHRVDERLRVRDDPERGLEHPPELRDIAIDVHQRLRGNRRGRQTVPLCRHVVQPGAERDDQVRLGHRGPGVGWQAVAEMAGEHRVVVGEDVLMFVAGGHRHLPHLAQPLQSATRVEGVDPAARDHERPSGRGQPGRDLADVVGAGGRRRRCRGVDRHAVDRLLEHVLGQRDHHGTGGARRGDTIGLGGHPRQVRRVGDLLDPLRHVGERGPVVDLLKGPATEVLPLDLADEEDTGHGVLVGCVHRDRRVAHPGTTTHQDGPRAASELGIANRHQTGAPLVAARDQVDLGPVVQGVEHREKALTRHAEDPVDAVRRERVDHQTGSGD